jgi:hypothetical protein
MRTVADFAGLLLLIIGGFILLFGWMVAGQSAGFEIFIGILLVAIGLITSYTATHKTCPQCAERVKHKALKCKHCGHQFGTVAVSSKSEPVQK